MTEKKTQTNPDALGHCTCLAGCSSHLPKAATARLWSRADQMNVVLMLQLKFILFSFKKCFSPAKLQRVKRKDKWQVSSESQIHMFPPLTVPSH